MRNTVPLFTLTLYLACSPNSRSATWARLGPNGGRIAALGVAPSDAHVVYAGGAFVYRSTDGGAHWMRTADVFTSLGPDAASPVVKSIVVSPKDPNRVAVGSPQGLFLTADGGVSWKRAGGVTTEVSSVAFSLDGRLLRASSGDTIYRSANAGDTWDSAPQAAMVAMCLDPRVNTGFIGARKTADTSGKILYRSDDGFNWYAFSPFGTVTVSAIQPSPSGDAVYVSSAGVSGGAWRVARDGTAAQMYAGPVDTLAATRSNPSCVFIAPASGSPAVLRSCDEGVSWDRLTTGFAGNDALALAVGWSLAALAGTEHGGVLVCDGADVWHPTNVGLAMATLSAAAQSTDSAHVLLATAGDGLYRSTNDGETWAKCHASTTRSVMDVTPARPGRVWHTGAEGIEKSDDNGQTWQHFTTGLPVTADVARIVAHPTLQNTAFVVTATGAVYQNTTSNPSWTLRLAAWPTAPTTIPDLAISPAQPSTMFAARPDGLYRSTDSGAHWYLRTANLPSGAILCPSPVDANVIYRASTIGLVVWVARSTDGGATWAGIRQETGAANAGFAATFLAMDRRKSGRILLGTNRGPRISDDSAVTWRIEATAAAGTFATGWAPCGATGDLLATGSAGLLRCIPLGGGAMSASDALRIVALANSPNPPTTADLEAWDMNEDGQITLADADLALRAATGP